MNKKYFALSHNGYWGSGETPQEAKDSALELMASNIEKESARFNVLEVKSELPFAPIDREATDEEADAWIDRHGHIVYARCTWETIEQEA